MVLAGLAGALKGLIPAAAAGLSLANQRLNTETLIEAAAGAAGGYAYFHLLQKGSTPGYQKRFTVTRHLLPVAAVAIAASIINNKAVNGAVAGAAGAMASHYAFSKWIDLRYSHAWNQVRRYGITKRFHELELRRIKVMA